MACVHINIYNMYKTRTPHTQPVYYSPVLKSYLENITQVQVAGRVAKSAALTAEWKSSILCPCVWLQTGWLKSWQNFNKNQEPKHLELLWRYQILGLGGISFSRGWWNDYPKHYTILLSFWLSNVCQLLNKNNHTLTAVLETYSCQSVHRDFSESTF